MLVGASAFAVSITYPLYACRDGVAGVGEEGERR